jgi:hypothetical protein
MNELFVRIGSLKWARKVDATVASGGDFFHAQGRITGFTHAA